MPRIRSEPFSSSHRVDPRCLYVQGIGSQASTDGWELLWDLALFGRPMGERTEGFSAKDPLRSRAEDQRRKPSAPESDESSVKAILKGADLDPRDEAAAAFVTRLMARLGLGGAVPVEAAGGKAAPATGSWRGRIAERFLWCFLERITRYCFDSDVRRRIRNRLRRRITRSETPIVLVAHGIGALVAYEALSELTPEQAQRVPLFVTLGSPLCIRVIQEWLTHNGTPIATPAGVAWWHNFATSQDPITLDSRLAGDFPNRSGVFGELQDHHIVNPSLEDASNFNPHDAASYLSHPEVRSVVHQAMRLDSAGRFVIARDVAHAFAAPDVRQPVLIEALELNYPAVDESHEEMTERESRQRKRSKRFTSLEGRIKVLAKRVKAVVEEQADQENSEDEVRAARIMKLRKYVSAHLTPSEIQALATIHADLNIYAMWRSSSKKKLIHRSHRAIGAEAARASFKSMGEGVTWAVLDTGCRFDHPHFRRRRGRDGAGIDNSLVIDVLDCTTTSDLPESITDANLSDPDGHGTHVSGIIAGRGRVRRVVYEGVAPKTRLLVYKVLNDHGVGEDAWIIKAIDDIFRRNASSASLAVHGVNLSLGGPFDATVYGCGFSPICKELRDLWRQGTLVCVAAGNEGQIQVSTQEGPFDLNTSMSIGDPANLEDCIAVGSVNTDKPYLYGISYFSSRGPTTDGRVKPDVVAPGERISSCCNDIGGRLYRESSGTSMACPHVSGLLAAFLSVRREFIGRPDDVKKILLRSCNDLGRDRRHQGHGIPNLMKMLTET